MIHQAKVRSDIRRRRQERQQALAEMFEGQEAWRCRRCGDVANEPCWWCDECLMVMEFLMAWRGMSMVQISRCGECDAAPSIVPERAMSPGYGGTVSQAGGRQ